MRIAYCFCGSFCTLKRSLNIFEKLASDGNEMIAVLSYNVAHENTRFFKAADFIREVEHTAPAIYTLAEAEPLGPKIKCDAMIIAPCTGNTISKLAANITDTPVTLAAKAHLRGERPLIIAAATNDGLGAAARSIGTLLARKHIYFVPFAQDDPRQKPRSVVADFDLIEPTLYAALKGEQLQPIIK